jgi:hypothetical protein
MKKIRTKIIWLLTTSEGFCELISWLIVVLLILGMWSLIH